MCHQACTWVLPATLGLPHPLSLARVPSTSSPSLNCPRPPTCHPQSRRCCRLPWRPNRPPCWPAVPLLCAQRGCRSSQRWPGLSAPTPSTPQTGASALSVSGSKFLMSRWTSKIGLRPVGMHVHAPATPALHGCTLRALLHPQHAAAGGGPSAAAQARSAQRPRELAAPPAGRHVVIRPCMLTGRPIQPYGPHSPPPPPPLLFVGIWLPWWRPRSQPAVGACPPSTAGRWGGAGGPQQCWSPGAQIRWGAALRCTWPRALGAVSCQHFNINFMCVRWH